MSKKLISLEGLTHEQWLDYRRKGIGGSDAGTICRLNPYSSLIELWADKTGRIPDKEDNEAMRVGRDLEQYVSERFCEETGKKVRRRNAIFRHDNHDFIIANIDREVIGEKAGLECKTTNMFNKSDFANGEIPPYFYCQCMHYMNVMNYEKMYLAVLVMGKTFYWFEIPYDSNEGSSLLKMEVDFWNNYIVPDVRPAPDGSASANRTLETIFKERSDNSVTLFEQEETAAELARIKAEKKALSLEEKRLQNILISSLENNKYGVTLNYELSYILRKRSVIDSKKLQKEFPEVYEKVKTDSYSNVFGIKERK